VQHPSPRDVARIVLTPDRPSNPAYTPGCLRQQARFRDPTCTFCATAYWFGHMKRLFCALLIAASAFASRASIHTETVDYKQGDATLEGFVAYDDAIQGQRPGILVVHQWMGLTDYEKKRAEMLAQLGYVAFCADICGKGIRPKNTQEAGALAGKYKGNRQLLRARVNAALTVLRQQALVDHKHVAAIGYCFGGTSVIELARSGADLAGIVSFHGGLDSPAPADGKKITCKVLVCHGADDPFESTQDMAAFENEMRTSGVDWQLIKYGGAVHSFTQPNAGNDNSKGAAYNGRVRERRCRHSLPSEPDVRVSPHPAQAATKPRVSGAGFTTV
jgi:dienelactone hydrolase